MIVTILYCNFFSLLAFTYLTYKKINEVEIYVLTYAGKLTWKKNIQVLENYETLIQENCTKVSFVQFKRELARF